MTNTEILWKAVNLSFVKGWIPTGNIQDKVTDWRIIDAYPRMYLDLVMDRKTVTSFDGEVEHIKLYVPEIIFNHDFAKALWEQYTETMTVQNNTLNVQQVIDMDGWRYHLQQMVVADNPIKYLGEHI